MARESPCGLDAEQAHGGLGGGVRAGRSADEADRERHLERADEVAVGILLELRERGVPAVAGGVRVATGLDRAGVVARGQHDGGDAVHDALVMGGRPVRVGLGERARRDDVVDDLRSPPSSSASNTARARVRRRSALLVRMRSSVRAAGDLGDARGDGLGHRVDRVRAHGVADVDVQVQDDLRAGACREDAHRDVAGATAEPRRARDPARRRGRAARRGPPADASASPPGRRRRAPGSARS